MTDSILFWNEVALEANRVSHTNQKMEQTGPTLSSRALAIVHLAIYDAYAAVVNDPVQLPPYWPMDAPPPGGASAQGAVAGAGHTSLSALFPSQRTYFDARLSEAMGAADSTLNAGFGFGVKVARRLLNDRAKDPDAKTGPYVPSFAVGRHRVDPDKNPGEREAGSRGQRAPQERPFYRLCAA